MAMTANTAPPMPAYPAVLRPASLERSRFSAPSVGLGDGPRVEKKDVLTVVRVRSSLVTLSAVALRLVGVCWVSPVDVTAANGASVVAVSASLVWEDWDWEPVVEESTEVNEDWLELGGGLKLEVTSAGGTEEKIGAAELCACVVEDA